MTILTQRFASGLSYAIEIQAGQPRKGTEVPYLSHLLGVAAIALENGASEDEAVGALLHEGPEDAGGMPILIEIRKRFGPAVADIVAGCSDTFEDRKPPWRKRKEAYIAHLKGASPSVLLVSASDKLHNARSITSDYRVVGEAVWAKFRGKREGTLWYYRSLADSFLKLSGNHLASELDRAVRKLERLAAKP